MLYRDVCKGMRKRNAFLLGLLESVPDGERVVRPGAPGVRLASKPGLEHLKMHSELLSHSLSREILWQVTAQVGED